MKIADIYEEGASDRVKWKMRTRVVPNKWGRRRRKIRRKNTIYDIINTIVRYKHFRSVLASTIIQSVIKEFDDFFLFR